MGRYLIALGSNVRHGRFGPPRRVLAAALDALASRGLTVEAASRVTDSAPLGPSRRRYANAAAVLSTSLAPEALFAQLQAIETSFGRRRGQAWGPRVLDLDIVLWSGGAFVGERLIVPHPEFRCRTFVLAPAAAIACAWPDPVTRLTVRQLRARLTRPRLTRAKPLP